MKNSMAIRLKEAKQKGVNEGTFLMAHIALISLENTMNKWDIPVDNQFYRDMEKDMNEVYQEVIASVPNGDVHEMAERLSFYVDEIRERREMDGQKD